MAIPSKEQMTGNNTSEAQFKSGMNNIVDYLGDVDKQSLVLDSAEQLKLFHPAVGKQAKTLDTGKVWLWDGSKWHDTGLSELDRANENMSISLFNNNKQTSLLSSFDDPQNFTIVDSNKRVIIEVDKTGDLANVSTKSFRAPFSNFDEKDDLYIVDQSLNLTNSNQESFIADAYVKKVEKNKLSVFIRGTKSNFIEYEIKRVVIPYDPNPADPANSQANADHWRIVAAYETNNAFERLWGGRRIVGDAWECAIREKNLADYMGTYHGDDVITESHFLVNGKIFGQDDLFETEINDFQVYQKGHLYRQNSQLKMCEYTRYHQFSKDGLNLKQWFKWLQPATLVESLITMLPIHRNTNYETASGQLISDESARFYSENILIEDLSVGGFEMKYTSFKSGDHIDIFGKTSGISAKVTMISTPEIPTATVHQANPVSTNKIYFNATGKGVEHKVAIGDRWFNHTHYQITTSN